jgi:hypothetical protein
MSGLDTGGGVIGDERGVLIEAHTSGSGDNCWRVG